MKPLTQAETDMLLILLRKLWKESETPVRVWNEKQISIERIAKNLFKQITESIYDAN